MTPMTTKKPPTLGQYCGLISGYNAHYRRGETACLVCKLVHREYCIEYRAKNPEAVKESQRKYRAKNPEKKAEDTRIRRAKKQNSLCIPYTVDEVLVKYGSDCHICLKPIDLKASRRAGYGEWQMGLNIDHLIPISHNGADTLENVRPSHAICNMTRGTKSLQ